MNQERPPFPNTTNPAEEAERKRLIKELKKVLPSYVKLQEEKLVNISIDSLKALIKKLSQD